MYGVIDIGSNTIRLVVFEYDGTSIRRVLNKKITAGLAGYINKDHEMRKRGVQVAVESLTELKTVTDRFNLEEMGVLATAPLRNIINTEEVLTEIEKETGYKVKVLSGQQEASYGFAGLRQQISMDEGIMIDVGGGSSEVVAFRNDEALLSTSIPWGSLNLYRKYVKEIIPEPKELKEIDRTMRKHFEKIRLPKRSYHLPLCVEGGAGRAFVKVLQRKYPEAVNEGKYGRKYLQKMLEFYKENPAQFSDLILRSAPERIHTLLPGMAALNAAADVFGVKEIVTVEYGVREGFLMEEILNKTKNELKDNEDTTK